MQTILKIDPTDNLIVALQDLRKEQRVHWNDEAYVLRSDVKAKHKFSTEDIAPGDIVSLYLFLVNISQPLLVSLR